MEIVRRAVEANRSGPRDATVEIGVELAHPDFEFTSRLTSVEGATYRGHDGVRSYFEDMADAWQEWRNEADEVTEVAPNAIFTENTLRATGRSGVDVELRSAVVFVLSGGKILKIHSHPSRQEALEAAGLSE